MTRRPGPAVLIALAVALATAPMASARQPDSLGADWRQQQDEARAKARSGSLAPLERVIATIKARTPGRLLDAGLETDPDGRSIYKVRWAARDGRRIDFRVDAASGAILSGG